MIRWAAADRDRWNSIWSIIEIREHVGSDNFFLFGLTADEVFALKQRGYNPRDYDEANPELRSVLDSIAAGRFSRGDTELFRPIVDSLLQRDEYLLLADRSICRDLPTGCGCSTRRRRCTG